MKSIILSVLLAGCAAVPTVPEEPTVYHPPWPAPVIPCDIEFRVLIVNDEPYVAVSFDDNLNAAICDNNKKRYVEELRTIVCHYRDNEDPRCKE